MTNSDIGTFKTTARARTTFRQGKIFYSSEERNHRRRRFKPISVTTEADKLSRDDDDDDLEDGSRQLAPSPSKFRRRFKRRHRRIISIQILLIVVVLIVAAHLRWFARELHGFNLLNSTKLEGFLRRHTVPDQKNIRINNRRSRSKCNNRTIVPNNNNDSINDSDNYNTRQNNHHLVKRSYDTPFEKFLSQVPFKTLEQWTLDDYDVFFTDLHTFVHMEPLVPINDSCRPPPLIPPKDITCDHINTMPGRPPIVTKIFQGKRNTTAKVGHAIQFGSADVDALEIHLNELYDVIDKFFIVEMVVQHNQLFPNKLLTWDHVKKQTRFRKFQDKIVHIVLDDVDVEMMRSTIHENSTRRWEAEHFQETYRWKRIQEWNEITNFFGPDDIIGFGDTDEIASRENVQIMKHCQFNNDIESIDVGIWFPYGKFDQAFSSDFPVPNNHWTLGDPTFWTFLSAELSEGKASRKRGTSPAYLLGGMHMSNYAYFPSLLLKPAMATEADGGLTILQNSLKRLRQAFHENKLLELQDELARPPSNDGTQMRLVKLKDISPRILKGVVYFPWFYDCNRNRYPRWEGNPDSRLGM